MPKTWFITGASRGFGREWTIAALERGDTVAATARDTPTLDDLVARFGDKILPIRLDVTDRDAVFAAVTEAHDRFGGLDVVVNNAGVGGGQPIDKTDTASWRRILDTNVLGTFLVTRQAVPMLPEGGRVINMSSVLGRFGVAGYTAYCASKHAVIGFTRALALELVNRRITVNAICPGWVETSMAVQGMQSGASAMGVTLQEFRAQALGFVPIRRMIEPDEVASLVKFLASPQAAAITGQAYNICGGQTMD
jgi:NAD(P)-dependent dehydrogenase (short-subunit alcohol dehydrogenase family)